MARTTDDPKDQKIPVMMSVDMVRAIDEWRSAQRPIPSRGEAIRKMIAEWLRQASNP